jgi:two-component system chemotaxis response regulator CheY
MPKTVIIIDDSKFIIDLLTKLYTETMHFSVVGTSTNGSDAVQLYREFKPDLLSLDIVMPNKDGVKVIEEILAEFPEAKILVISAMRGDTMIECLQKGIADYITKPLKIMNPGYVREFERVVRRVVG